MIDYHSLITYAALVGSALGNVFQGLNNWQTRRVSQSQQSLNNAEVDKSVTDTELGRLQATISALAIGLNDKNAEITRLDAQLGAASDRIEKLAGEMREEKQHCDQRLDAQEARHKADQKAQSQLHSGQIQSLKERLEEVSTLNLTLQLWALREQAKLPVPPPLVAN